METYCIVIIQIFVAKRVKHSPDFLLRFTTIWHVFFLMHAQNEGGKFKSFFANGCYAMRVLSDREITCFLFSFLMTLFLKTLHNLSVCCRTNIHIFEFRT